MKIFITSALLLCLAGCTIPCDIYFRNFSGQTVRLQATLLNRERFEKLPNKVALYDTAQKKRSYCGNWRSQKLVTWTDSTHFYMDVPAATVIDIADISNGLKLGSTSPKILLLAVKAGKIDTLLKGDYLSIAEKFKFKKSVFSRPVYYYDTN